MNKFDIYKQMINNSLYNLVETHEKIKDLNIVYDHQYQRDYDLRLCTEVNVPRQAGKSETLVNLAYQYQKVIFIVINENMKTDILKTHRYLNKDHVYSISKIRDDLFRGINLHDYIFILDEVSLTTFFTKMEKDAPISYSLLMNGISPVFSVTTRYNIP